MTADKWTDQELEKLERRIAREYVGASQELKQKAEAYFSEYKVRWEQEHKAYLDGKYTDEQFKAWELAQLGRGARWEDLKDQMTERLAQSALIAQDYINGKLPAIYTKNSNEVAKIAQESAIEQGVTGIRFDLVDEYAVKRLMEGSLEVKPYKPIAIDLPKTNRYNYTKLQNALLQGILQGDSINKIADRFQMVSNMNQSSAIRNARTACTGAQNAGKQDRYADIASKGGQVFKMWKATHDERTRDEHMQAMSDYGSRETAIPYDEPFDVGGDELMYPADPSGSGWNVYNCRCTMSSFTKFKSILSDETRNRANIRLVEDKPLNEANTKPQTQISEEEKALFTRNYDCEMAQKCGEDYYNEICERVERCENSDLIQIWSNLESQIGVAETNVGRGFCDFQHKIHINTDVDSKGKSWKAKFETTFHEAGHAIDMILRDKGSRSGFYYSYTYKDGIFPQTIKREINAMVDAIDKRMKQEFKDHKGDYSWLHDHGFIDPYNWSWYERYGRFMAEPKYSKVKAYKSLEKEVGQLSGMQMANLSDIMEGATKCKIEVGYGHGKSYWDKNDSSLATEAFAEMTGSLMANDESTKILRQYLPESFKVYEEMLKDALKEV